MLQPGNWQPLRDRHPQAVEMRTMEARAAWAGAAQWVKSLALACHGRAAFGGARSGLVARSTAQRRVVVRSRVLSCGSLACMQRRERHAQPFEPAQSAVEVGRRGQGQSADSSETTGIMLWA